MADYKHFAPQYIFKADFKFMLNGIKKINGQQRN